MLALGGASRHINMLAMHFACVGCGLFALCTILIWWTEFGHGQSRESRGLLNSRQVVIVGQCAEKVDQALKNEN